MLGIKKHSLFFFSCLGDYSIVFCIGIVYDPDIFSIGLLFYFITLCFYIIKKNFVKKTQYTRPLYKALIKYQFYKYNSKPRRPASPLPCGTVRRFLSGA